jgi:hypothetical protein
MQRIRIMTTAIVLGIAAGAHAGDAIVKPEIPPAEINVTIKAEGEASEADIAAAIASENAKRDPAAQAAAAAAKQRSDADAAHAARVGKVCDSISEDAMRRDPSLRRMCQ